MRSLECPSRGNLARSEGLFGGRGEGRETPSPSPVWQQTETKGQAETNVPSSRQHGVFSPVQSREDLSVFQLKKILLSGTEAGAGLLEYHSPMLMSAVSTNRRVPGQGQARQQGPAY
mmetsp:Transcript_55765/g.109166  ORF Transcript_55765/g.109166 Transcript_55765/m.109166 type:complete len:117 (+) Transcript_55765:2298-2648(+)